MEIYAHSLPGSPAEFWQTLDEHSSNVARLCEQFALTFDMPKTAYLLGLMHDLGKSNPVFQEYLKATGDGEEDVEFKTVSGRKKGPDHSIVGAKWLDESVKGVGRLLAYAVAGHHAGLPDGLPDGQGSHGALLVRLGKSLPEGCLWPQSLTASEVVAIGQELRTCLASDDGFAVAFVMRMLYSCLVDADFLDTELFMNASQAEKRNGAHPRLEDLLAMLEKHYEELDARTKEAGLCQEPVSVARNEVRRDCVTASEEDAGMFTLRVPTGGGKTLASMLFALKHAVKHGLQRIIVVIPYTSIIEQTASVYRNVFGDENVLEHHSSVDPDGISTYQKLVSENWDAPIVVTTNVQFFESLFASRSSRCRKIHNIVKSVVILDEAQSLPIEVVKPCLKALEELTVRYGSSVVLSTATLPVFFDRSILGRAALTGGRTGVRDIVPAERKLFDRLKRTKVERVPGRISDDEIVSQLALEGAALVIVSTRRHARELYLKAKTRLADRPVYHLSAQMCGAHRAQALSSVKASLRQGEPCVLVSTQLIEAGVDIDFPCVYREIAGLDSMAQSAGRCNREGLMPECGRVLLFESADYEVPRGYLRSAAQQGRLTLQLEEVQGDLLGEDAVRRYFELLYSDVQQGDVDGLDSYQVLSRLLPAKRPKNTQEMLLFKFRELGETFKLIDDNSCSVIVPYGEEGRMLCDQLRAEYVPSERRLLLRRLQRYAVSMFGEQPLDKGGNLIADLVHDVCWILTSPDQYYSDEFGMMTEPRDIFLEC